jgi:hypothetical protein
MRILEKLGISLSMACAVHCMAMPVALAFLPSLGNLVTEEVELFITLSSLLIAVFVLGKDIRLHKNPLPIIILISSFAIVLLSLMNHKYILLDILGIAGILTAYLLNWYKLKKAKACACA